MTETTNVAHQVTTGEHASEAARQLRAAIFSKRQLNRKTITFMGQRIELRQPLVKDMLESGADLGDDQTALVRLVIRYAYVPGTDTRVFNESHVNDLLALPYTADFNDLAAAIGELTAGDVKGQVKN